jgi:putative transposase
MPHHWHALIKTAPPSDISRVMNGIKTQSAIAIRRKMDAKGPIWQARFYDHVCRDHDEYLQAVDYVHRNPVEAGLVGSPEEWPWSSWFGYMGGGIPAVPVQLINRPFDAHWAEWHRHAPPWRRA